MAEKNNNGFPMLSERNWWVLRDKFKASVPTTVSPNYAKSLLTLGSDASANSNVITPMKRLGLLDDENKPTQLANDWRLDDKYEAVCDSIVEHVYPTELLDLFPDSSVDRNSAKNWFMGSGVGEAAAVKMTALFILLKTGKVKDTKSISEKNSLPSIRQKSKKQQSSKSNKITPINSPTDSTSITASQFSAISTRPNLHIDLQIHISADSTPDQIESIFASMAKHLYGADNS